MSLRPLTFRMSNPRQSRSENRQVQWELFDGVPATELQRVLEDGASANFKCCEVVFHRRDQADSLHLVLRSHGAQHLAKTRCSRSAVTETCLENSPSTRPAPAPRTLDASLITGLIGIPLGVVAATRPCIVLGIGFTAVLMRRTRSAMVTSLNADYIRTARAKGPPQRRIIVSDRALAGAVEDAVAQMRRVGASRPRPASNNPVVIPFPTSI